MNVVDTVAATSSVLPAFSNVQLWTSNGTLLGTAQSAVADASGTGHIYTFNSLTGLVVPQGNSVSLTLKGDAGSFTQGSMTDNTTLTFQIATTTDSGNSTTSLTVVARGNTSNKTAGVTLSGATGNAQTILRTILAVSATPVTTLPPNSFQQIGSVTFTANAAGDAKVNNLNLSFNNTSGTFLNTVTLHDPSGNDIVLVDNLASSTTTPASGLVTWTFATSSKPLVITAGTSYTMTLWGDLSKIPAIPSQGLTLTASISNKADFSYYDGTNNNLNLISLMPQQVPITVVNLSSGSGLPL